MNFKKIIFFFSMLVMSISAYASGTMNENEIKNIDRIEVSGDEMRQRLSITAGLLTEYEIEAKKFGQIFKEIAAKQIIKKNREPLKVNRDKRYISKINFLRTENYNIIVRKQTPWIRKKCG